MPRTSRHRKKRLDSEIKRLQGIKQTFANKRTGLLAYVQTQMEKLGLTKAEAGLHKARIQKNPIRCIIKASHHESLQSLVSKEVVDVGNRQESTRRTFQADRRSG